MTTKERLLEFLAYKGIGQTKFEEIAKISRGLVNNMGESLSQKTQDKISKSFPELNMEWLTRGDGEMMLSTPKNAQFIEKNHGTAINGDGVVVHPSDCSLEVKRLQDRVDALIEQNGKLLNIIDRLTQIK